MTFKSEKTNSSDSSFIKLVDELNAYLKIIDGTEHDFYNQFNGIENLNHVIVIYTENEAVGCGAIKMKTKETAEIKRMYVTPTKRGKGIATLILHELEQWAKELNFTSCILETGKKQKEAVSLYHKNGYKIIPNFEPYCGVENSLSFEKKLIS